jgi:RHS repeat-associated protein
MNPRWPWVIPFVCAGAALAAAREARAQTAELCGNLIDDDNDGRTDEECYPSMATTCESPLSCSDTGWVSWTTGSLHYDLPPDVAPRSPYGHDIVFRRFYTSQYAPGALPASVNRTPLGPGWQHNYMSWIHFLPPTPHERVAVVHTTDGRDVRFQAVSSDGLFEYYEPQAGHRYQWLRRTHDGVETQLRTLYGDTLVYDAHGRLSEVRDAVAEPNTNKVRVAWTAAVGGNIDTITDATGVRRLKLGYTDDRLTSIQLQLLHGAAWTTYHTTSYAYAGGALRTVTIGGQHAQTNVYDGGDLTRIDDGEGKQMVAFRYAAPGVVSLVETANGHLGFEYDSSRAQCAGDTILYFNKGHDQSCSVDSDCGAGLLCGGRSGATGTCFRAARCLTIDETGVESLVTGVRPLGPPSESCSGACAEISQYVWNPQTFDLQGVKDALGSFTSASYNDHGLPTKIVYADADAHAGNGGGKRAVYFLYDPFYPGRLREVRRPSVLLPDPSACSEVNASGCARTYYFYDYAAGKLSHIVHTGFTKGKYGDLVEYDYTTTRTHDSKGRILSIDGPLPNGTTPGTDRDVTTFVYSSNPDPRWSGFLSISSVGTSATTWYSQYPLDYDFWGNPTVWRGVDGVLTCQEFHAARNYLSASGRSFDPYECELDEENQIVERYTRDSALRLTRERHPDGSCTHYEYDARGRLARVKPRDDCDPASAGEREEYSYDADGLLTEIAAHDAAGVVRRRQLAAHHDSRRPARIINPVDVSKHKSLTYDERGVMTRVDDEAGLGRTSFAVDDDYRLTSVTRATSATAADTWGILHDWLGHIRAVIDPDNKLLELSYDDLGRLLKQTSPDQTTLQATRSYTPHHRVASATSQSQTTSFRHDSLGRLLAADYPGKCNSQSKAEIEHVYDRTPQGMLCPLPSTGCIHYGRLVYTRVTLGCLYDAYDGTLDQETFYGYDGAGRLVEEHIRDDAGRVARQSYAWDKSGNLTQVTLPSQAVLGTTYGSSAGNSDAALPTALWRTSPATPIIDRIAYHPGGVLKQYDRQDRIAGVPLRMRIDYNLAARPTLITLEGQTGGGPYYYLRLAEDAKGRVIRRDYYPSDPQLPGVFDSHFLYDQQDRVICETTSHAASCPASGAAIKNALPLGFTGAGDRKTLLRPIAGSAGGLTHLFNLSPGTHRVASVDQPDGVPAMGVTQYSYNAKGHRVADDNMGFDTHVDPRSYWYDGRDNVVSVTGQRLDPATGETSFYSVDSLFDARNRRVYKSHVAFGKVAQWFYYYDPLDRLVEVRHTPDASAPATYTTYQLIWLEDLLVAYWQTDHPSGATSKRYTAFDETGRPVRMHSWVAGNSFVSWAINPDAWGADRTVIGQDVYQPIVFAGQYRDVETAAYLDDGVTLHRPALVLNGRRTYDPFTGGYLQLDPLVKDTWSPYSYADNDPVGKDDPTGLATSVCVEWNNCSATGSNSIEIVCKCSKYDSSGPSPRPMGGGPGPQGPRELGDGGGRGRGGGAARAPRTPRTAPRRLWPVERPAGLGDADDAWYQQCRADIMTGMETAVEWTNDTIVELVQPRVATSGNHGPVGSSLRLGNAANFIPGGQWGGLDWEISRPASAAEIKFFCDKLRTTLHHYGSGQP